MALIMGGTTDAFCAAKQELLVLLNWADDCATFMVSMNKEHYLIIESKIYPTQKYNYCGRFRYTRRLTCLMYNFERIFEPLLMNLCRNQGLNNDAE